MKLDEITQRPMGYIAETGVPWLASGIVFSLLGGSSLIQQALPLEYKLIPGLVAIVFALVVFLGAWALKRRVVFPRGGYVQPQDPEWGTRELIYMALTFAGLGALFVTLKQFTTESWFELSGTVFAICFAVIIGGSGWKSKRPKMYWFAGYLLCVGALLFWLRLPYTSLAALQLGIGAPLAGIGAIRLRKFLKANPLVEDSGE
jgi:hypothetical protein